MREVEHRRRSGLRRKYVKASFTVVFVTSRVQEVRRGRRYGFDDADVTAPGSDRLIDALVAWGDEQAIAERVGQHRQAGADHVCIQVMVDRDDMAVLPVEQWRRLAPALI